MKIINKEYVGQKHVYDIGLSGPHNFMLENGIFASNCFNKSHSVAYSYLTYITAYLKANYPVEFFCSLMTTRSKSLQPKDWAQKAPQYVNEARQLGVEINPPSVNASNLEFTIADNEIYFGLNAIRDVGKTAAKSIVIARGQTPFKDIFNFVERVNTQKVNTKTFSALIKAGAFDKMGYLRENLEENMQAIYDYYKDIQAYEERILEIKEREEYNAIVIPKIERRNSLRKLYKSETNKRLKNKQTLSELDFTKLEIELQELEDLSLKKKVSLKEKEEPVKPEIKRYTKVKLSFKQVVEQANYIGCYTDIHPVNLIKTPSYKISKLMLGEYSRVAAVITMFKEITTRKTNKKMAFIELDDSQIIAEGVIFPNVYAKIKHLDLQVGSLVLADVKIESEDPYKMIINNIIVYEG